MSRVYVVNWEREGSYVFTNKDSAIKKIEEITGVREKDWNFDTGDVDECGRDVWYHEADMEEQKGENDEI